MKARSRDLAERLLRDRTEEAGRLEIAWLLVFNRPIADDERTGALDFLQRLRDEDRTVETEAVAAGSELRRWTEMCRVLLANNEFLMRM
jgi:hypothetical protein